MRALVLTLLVGCSSQPTMGDAGPDVVPAQDAPQTPTTQTFIMRRMFAGDSDRAFKPNMAAWRTLGDDIDGKASTAASTDVCKLATGAPASVHDDGDGGVDNSFGANVIPALIAAGFPSPSLQWSQATTQAAVRVGLLTLGPSGVELRLGALPPGPITFDGTGVWPISSLSVMGDAPNVRWSDAPTATAMKTGRSSATGLLTIPQNMGTLVLRVHLMAVRGALDGSTIQNGIVSGVLDTTELLDAVKQVAGANKGSCSTAIEGALTKAVTEAQDILHDGTQDPNKPCDAISIGLGFDGTIVKLGAVQADPGPARPCP